MHTLENCTFLNLFFVLSCNIITLKLSGISLFLQWRLQSSHLEKGMYVFNTPIPTNREDEIIAKAR